MTTPGIGDIVYLTSCIIDTGIYALTTPPDTPNQYTASLAVAGDSGNMNLDAVTGPQGPDGQPLFTLRYQRKPLFEDPDDLPTLTESADDIGKYWLINELDVNGFYVTTWAYIWWGSFYRQVKMGTTGVVGPVPGVRPLTAFVPPGTDASIKVTGSSVSPTWEFLCPSPTGAPGPAGWLGEFPDVNEVTTAPETFNVLAFTHDHVWEPFNIEQFLPQTYSMPQSAFTPFIGSSQQANIGSFTLPAQNYPWTPLVWGHLSAGGLTLGSDPLRIGTQVLLGNATSGQMVGRGIGTTIGAINIYPHYSTPGSPNVNIQPKNRVAMVPAGQTATLYVNLWNDGQLGFYSFTPNSSIPGWQQNLNNLGSLLGAVPVTIEGVVTQLNNFAGSIPANIQAGLNSIVAMVGQVPVVGPFVNATINDVTQVLTGFNTVVTALADALGLTGIEQAIGNVAAQLQSWASTVTAQMQNNIDAVANQLGLPGVGHATHAVASTLASLEPELRHLANLLGNPIGGIITLLDDFVGTVTTDIHDAVNAVAGALGFGPGLSLSQLSGHLGTFQGLLDDVANATGLSGTGHAINTVIGAVAPFAGIVIGDVLQPAIDGVVNFLGTTGTGHTILKIIDQLLGLLGNLFSGYTSDAQLYIQVQPLLELETL